MWCAVPRWTINDKWCLTLHCPWQWWKYKFRGPGTVKWRGPLSWLRGPPLIVVGLNHTWKKICRKRLYSNIRIPHAVYRHTKHFCLCGETVYSSFFSFAFNSLKNINITPQHHMILSFLLHFYPGHLQQSHLQCSVPRSAFKDFCITRLGCLSTLVDRMAKIETKDWKRVEVLEEGAASPLHQLGDLWSAVSSPMD